MVHPCGPADKKTVQCVATSGLIFGERNYHSPKTREELAGMGVELVAPYSSKKLDPSPKKSALLRAGSATG